MIKLNFHIKIDETECRILSFNMMLHNRLDHFPKPFVSFPFLQIGHSVIFGFLPHFDIILVAFLGKGSPLDSCQYSTTFLLCMRTITETALVGQFRYFVERLGKTRFNIHVAQFPHPRRIDDHGSVFQMDELPNLPSCHAQRYLQNQPHR